MKVQVVVKNLNKNAPTSTTIATTVGPAETALAVQERIGSVMSTLCFPDQKLYFNGNAIPGNQCMSACSIKDGDVLELAFEASEQTLVNQLSALLGEKAMSPEELSLLYSLRHFASVSDVFTALGLTDTKFQAFLGNQKCFSFDGVVVKALAHQKVPVGKAHKTPQSVTNLCPIQEDKLHGPIGVRVSVEVHMPGKMPEALSEDEDDGLDLVRLEPSATVATAKRIISASQQLPFPDCDLLLGQENLDDQLCLNEAGVTNGDRLVLVVRASEASLASQLEELLLGRVGLSQNELSLHYCQRFGTPVSQALRILGLPGKLGNFLAKQPQKFMTTGGCVTLVNDPKRTAPSSDDEFQECQ
jgi:hypothetical protein